MIAVTGATGQLGRLVVEDLLERGVPAGEVVAAVRSPEKASDLEARGVQVRRADYEEPGTLGSALEGVEKLLLVSSNEVGRRTAHHQNVIDAAREADIRFLAYTSILNADASQIQLAEEHQETERAIRASGLPFAFLRNGWYTENYTAQIPQVLEQGAILGCAGDGPVSAAPRVDYAAAAAAVLTGEGHEGAAYELGGDEAFTMDGLAEELSRQSGEEVVYHDLPPEEYAEALAGAGLPDPVANVLVDAERGVARGELYTDRQDLSRLIDRPTTPMPEVVRNALPG